MSQYTFKFIIADSGLSEDCFTLLSFTGEERISTLFDFELELKCDDVDLDEDKVLNQVCRLEIYHQIGTVPSLQPMRVIQGMVNEFEDTEYYPDHTLYRARMVPRVWQLGLFETNEVYLEQPIADTLTTMLEEAGFVNGQDFRFALNRQYRKWPFRLQYKETHLAYLQRIIEREGIYYYFEDSEQGEVMVFCDHNQALPSIAARGQESGSVHYQTSGAINPISNGNTLTSIICKRHSLPKKITLRDFNDETPSLDIRGEFLIDNKGMGEINLYGLNIVSPEEGEELAEIHANAFICRHKIYSGEGDIATLAAGHTFTLENHPRAAFNELPFLLESVSHEGANLVEGGHEVNQVASEQANYVNTFSAFNGELEFAPQRQTSVPEIKGTLNAVVDAEADSDYAELDGTGRYKVKLPFDRRDRDGGKASHWVRMMQPYGGTSEGMHFPLRKGTRVLLGFIAGDPDRPFITGAINDSGDQQSVVTDENQTNNLIKTASGNKIEMEDQQGKNRIKMATGDNKTYMHLGAPNHAGDGFVIMTKGMQRKEVIGGYQSFVAASGASYEDASGTEQTIPTRQDQKASGDSQVDKTTTDHQVNDAIDEQAVYAFNKKNEDGQGQGSDFSKDDELLGQQLFERRIGDRYVWTAGNEYVYGGDKVFNFGNAWDEEHINETGIDDNSESFGADMSAIQNARNTDASHTTKADGNYDWGDDTRAIDPDNQFVEMKWGDQYEYHHGRRFEWCSDPADYGFGNGYSESLIKSNTETINATYDHDKAKPGGPKYNTINGELVKGLEAGSTAASKTIGNSYNYTNGDTLEVTVGKSESHNHGNSHSEVHGNSYEEVHGHAESHVRGSAHSTHHGATNSMFMGATSDFMFGVASSIALSGSSDIQVGASNSMFLGLKTDFCISAGFEGALGPMTTVFGTDIEAKVTALETKVTGIEGDVTNIKSNVTAINNQVSDISAAVNFIQTKATTLRNGGITVDGTALTLQ